MLRLFPPQNLLKGVMSGLLIAALDATFRQQ